MRVLRVVSASSLNTRFHSVDDANDSAWKERIRGQ